MRAIPRVMLASRSPRRRELLARWGVQHDVIPAAVDDSGLHPGCVRPEQWAVGLAHLKARAAADSLKAPINTDHVVLGADTVIDKNGTLVGTPVDEADARRILKLLAGGSHSVITGVALLHQNGSRTLTYDSAQVALGQLSDGLIDSYLAKGAWSGKAGGYNLAERIADGWPITFTGDPTTVMGLPMNTLARLLGIPQLPPSTIAELSLTPITPLPA